MQDLVRRAIFLGVGLASLAAEKAGSNLQELRVQAQKLADALVARGEMTTEEARRYVDELMREAQGGGASPSQEPGPREPRRIEIITEDEEPPRSTTTDVEDLRKQIEALQAELRRVQHGRE